MYMKMLKSWHKKNWIPVQSCETVKAKQQSITSNDFENENLSLLSAIPH